jgi:molybdate transport system ATP-binding protein
MSDQRGGLTARLRQQGPIPLDAELEAAPGELVALVGPSGSGKSTILKAIAGLYRPQHGKIACAGAVWLDTSARRSVPPQQRRVGLVFQHYALFPHMTARGNVAAALGHLPRAGRRRRAEELLDLVHLAGLEQRRPSDLSGGQQQRVALARALARDPGVLLLDEPFSAVDQVTRRRLQHELAQLRRRVNVPILLVTHDLDEAQALADRITVLHRGRTLQTGSPAEIMSRPASVDVARLVDLRNVFEGEVLEHRPEQGLTIIRWREHALEARHAPSFPERAAIAWLVPSKGVVLHRRDRPSKGEHENPLRGVVSELLVLGDAAHVTMAVGGREDQPLVFTVPVHVATRNRLTRGEPIAVSLLASEIHLMPRRAPAAEITA